jgi:phospholipid transport system substrate-binding protein
VALHTRRVSLRLLAGAAGLALAIPGVGSAGAADEPAAKLIEGVAAQVIDLIKTKPPGPEREQGIRKVLEQSFDLADMGRSALATYWDQINAQQQERFLKAAVAAEARAYSERFGQYGGQTLVVEKVEKRPKGVDAVLSHLNQTSGQPIKIEWHVRNDRIIDVKIEGVSMVFTRRSDYKSFISNHGNKVEPLIEELEQRAKAQ